jgi:hypothetical protein
MYTSILYSEISSLYILPVGISSTDILSHIAYNVLIPFHLILSVTFFLCKTCQFVKTSKDIATSHFDYGLMIYSLCGASLKH